MINSSGTLPYTVLCTILNMLEEDELDNTGLHREMPETYYAEKENLLSGEKARCYQVKNLIDRYKRSCHTGFIRSRRSVPLIKPVFDITRKYVLVRFYDFSADTISEIHNILMPIKSIEKVIFDISCNTGGNVDACAKLLNLFLPEGTQLFQLEYANKTITYHAYDTQKLICNEIQLITSEHTVSSAEIFTESLLAHFTGKISISGDKTFGKKTGQSTYRFSSVHNWEFRLNSFIWHT